MNILLLTNCIAQPDDVDKSVNDLVFSFALEWKKAGHRVVIVNSESKFPILFYKMPRFVINFFKKHGNFTIPSLASRKPLFWERDGISIARFPIFKPFPHCSFRKKQYLHQEHLIKEYLGSLDFTPDVITGHWLEPQLVLINDLASFYGSKKAIVIHGELPRGLSASYKKMMSGLDIVFFRSVCVKNKMISLYGDDFLRPSKTKVCYSGIPDKFVFEQKARTDWSNGGRLKFVFAGRLEKYKRIDTVLLALKAAFPHKNFSFEVVGSGPEFDDLVRLTKKIGLEENVHFTGRVSRDQVIERMRTADCFVMPSENEVFGLVYLEAMSCGCLTIASKNGGVDGIIKDGDNGFLCSQGDVRSLTETLVRIDGFSNSEKSRIRKSGYETVKAFTDSKAAKSYIDAIVKSDNR